MMWITDRDIRPFRIDDVGFSAIDEADALNQPAKYIAVFFNAQHADNFAVPYHRR